MKKCVILNSGLGAWAFQELADNLANELNIKISETPGDYNYVLAWDKTLENFVDKSFIPFEGIKLASDKREQAKIFKDNNIPTPETHLLNNYQDVIKFIGNNFSQWCLKYPVGCGASGHRIINNVADIPQDWLRPYVVQKFIYLDNPMVYRIYCAGKKLLGWNVRKFPQGVSKKPWVAHAQGAVYEILDRVPNEVINIATKTLKITRLFDSFGCVDFIQDNQGKWLVLEVGTDGIFNHVDRHIENQSLEKELSENIAKAFWLNLKKS
ncbi:conserved hypothetical protein [Hyella patelloides LEGE 07179]|uniref:ATP-grasp fold PylC-type domain-containing protein n=1 Tax=Hyella patelloides LEGE 07179 TaxID=945734 RepID=A0A563VMS4_9CYAN|nr:ATP-grasp domain-containing protein [Hyella patelloides]VEP12754.1 conserved hypothetical protein [Hyella patelloides LEGE 07179]